MLRTEAPRGDDYGLRYRQEEAAKVAVRVLERLHPKRVMDIFKLGWRDIHPSVHPMNEFFAKESHEDRGIERNETCPCESGKKFKKFHGR